MNGRRRGENNGHHNTITVECAGCGAEVSKPVSLIMRRNNRVYCPECPPPGPPGGYGFYVGYPPAFDAKLRKKIRERDNYTCQLCGTVPDHTLHVHHIDYDKGHNEEANLISLCRPCHGRTNWAAGVWKERLTEIMATR